MYAMGFDLKSILPLVILKKKLQKKTKIVMCGIIGINSSKPVSATIINSLKKLEYRGYDSAGIATLSSG